MEKEKAITILQSIKAGTADAFIRKAVIKDAIDLAISALEKQSVDKCCETCKHKDRLVSEWRCSECFRASNLEDYWEPYKAEEEDE